MIFNEQNAIPEVLILLIIFVFTFILLFLFIKNEIAIQKFNDLKINILLAANVASSFLLLLIISICMCTGLIN